MNKKKYAKQVLIILPLSSILLLYILGCKTQNNYTYHNILDTIQKYDSSINDFKKITSEIDSSGRIRFLKIRTNPDEADHKTYEVFFHPNGQFQCIYETNLVEEKNGQIHCYYSNGFAELKGSYRLNKKYGRWKYYSRYGELEQSSFYFDGNPMGGNFKYDSTGRLIEYCLVRSDQTCLYSNIYDSKEQKYSTQGFPLIFSTGQKQSFSTLDTIYSNISVAQNDIVYYEISIFDTPNNLIIKNMDLEKVRGEGIYILKTVFKAPGNHQVPIILKKSSLDKRNLEIDTLQLAFPEISIKDNSI